MEDKIPYPERFQDVSDNIYEAVMIVAKRARKIAANQKIEIERNMNVVEPEEETDEESEVSKVYLSFKKPTIIAISELEKQELEYNYKGKSST